MQIAVRQSSLDRAHAAKDAPKCPQCRTAALVMQRRHVSPPRWGEPVVTEYYDCDYCDASYQFSPADNRWKPIYH
jgi:hypothetical protein